MPYGLDIGTGMLRLVGEDGPVASEPSVCVPLEDAALETLLEDLFSDADGDSVHYTTPGTVVDADVPEAIDPGVVETKLSRLGFDPTPVSSGLAVVYDGLEDGNVTGLGVCIEEGATNVTLVYYGVPVLAFSLSKGGDWIVKRVTSQTGRSRGEVAEILENFTLDPSAANDPVENALAEAYDALTAEVIDAIRTQAADGELQRGLAVPVVIGGERAVDGLEVLMGGRFDDAALPLSVRDVVLAEEPAWNPARGALEAARDGLDGYEGVTRWEAEDGESTNGADGTEASFQFEGTRAEDASGEDLFDRLTASGDTLAEDVAALIADLEYVESGLEDDVEELDDRLEEFAADLEDLEAETPPEAVDDLAETTEALGDRIASLESTVGDDLKERIDDLETDDARLETLESRITGLSGRIAELQAHTDDRIDGVGDDLKERIDDLEGECSTVRSTLDALEATLEDAPDERRVEDVESTLEGLKDGLDRVTDDLETLEDDLADMQASLEDVASTISEVEPDLENTTERVESLASALSEERNRCGALEERTTDTETRLGDLESTLEAVTRDLEAVRQESVSEGPCLIA